MSVKLSSDTLTDLSTVKLYKVGKNLLDAVNAPAFTNLQDNSSINVEKTNTGCKFIGKRDTISNSGRFGYQFMPIARLRGKTVTLSFKRYSEANDTNTSTCALIQAAVNDFDGDLSLFTTPLTNANTYGEIKLSAAVNGYFTYTFVVPENETRENLFIIFYAGVGAVVPQNGVIEYSEVQAEVDNVATEYEPGVYAEYTPNADGTVEGVTSCQYPTTELHTDTEGVIIEVQYIKDTNSFCHDITTALMGEIVKAENALNNELAIIVSNITRIEQECKYSRNALYGKKWVACGDSYTAGDFTGFVDENGLSGKDSPLLYDTEWQMYKTYPWWIAKRNNMTLINEARCGTTMALTKQYVDGEEGYAESYRNPFSLNRYKAIPTDTDYITLWFGINDRSNTHLGNIADTENTTFYGAWNVVLEYLITNMPYAKIGIIVTNRCNEEYRQAIRDIAKKWGIPYLDMMGDDKVPLIFGRETNLGLSETAYSLRNDAFSVSTSNPHPNIKAHEYESTFVEDFLRRL